MNIEEEKAYIISLIEKLNIEQLRKVRVYLDELLGGK